ncbi:polysaccharide deacetylase family protein [Anaerocolumna xylanovorans]|uniref:Peptidoglycan/xylan/chitin deacetylase, PgdA/CDA1 family n=1 Tax=Anaerocolumna xylanovorans DSM 12503 TaxID=1121345 RepID=A0A1M7YEQ0_9FIRM|nr:polysaccharide deacetylase family protein [Anaerocolumna xylanovorans]SHO50978.1 Peptidoglycan/xylan/chitin deacetylase, PgdA/CDA1 family [Anaerocolumna xylanovorans DSM 12503]
MMYNNVTLYSETAKNKLTKEELDFYEGWDANCLTLKQMFPDTVFIRGNTDISQVALSFDDAPDTVYTPQILDILREYHLKASFSIVGEYIEKNREILQRIYQEGHNLINHTYSHRDLTRLSKSNIKREITSTEQMIYEITGFKTVLLRPPYGKLDVNSCRVITECNYKAILWSYNTCDWVADCKEDILCGMCSNIRNGEIILLHSYENKKPTVNALFSIIEELLKNGIKFVSIDDMIQ